MLRSLLLIFALTFSTIFSSATVAASGDLGDLFVPTEGDYSLFIIGKIFGPIDANILPGQAAATGPKLLGKVFGVFNIVTLGLGVIMVLYTAVLAILQSAHHGKAMGEKMSSMWIPIRMAIAIALLIPKANGYCIAQVMVMWLVVQGVGAADSLWNVALDYFETGGSLEVESGVGGGAESLDTSLSVVYGNFLKGLLVSGACVNAHNLHKDVRGEYFVYSHMQGGKYYLNFGRAPAANTTITDTPQKTYYECGRVSVNLFNNLGAGNDAANAKHLEIIQQYAKDLSNIGYLIAKDAFPLNEGTAWDPYSLDVRADSTNYVTTMEGNDGFFIAPDDEDLVDHIDVMRQGGWILAGNYYQILASLENTSIFSVDSSNTPSFVDAPAPAEQEAYQQQIQKAEDFYIYFNDWASENRYTDEETPQKALADDIKAAMEDQASIFSDIGFTAASVNHMKEFMDTLTGEEGTTDPILRAARFGKSMMDTAAITMISLATILPVVAIGAGICTASSPGGVIMNTTLATVLPLTYGIMGFMYTQGAALGIYLPMVPFIIFAIGGVGWVFAVVESMVAGPLVALGMTLPEGHEIYGKAEPAYMLLINLFLRPSLMILGFIAAIMVAWLAVDFINICMENALNFGGLSPDKFFGHFVVSFMYVGILITLLTKVFGLINMVPDRVLRWIGDNSTAFMGAEEVLQGGKQGSDQTAGQVSQSGQGIGGGYGRITGHSWEGGFSGRGKVTPGANANASATGINPQAQNAATNSNYPIGGGPSPVSTSTPSAGSGRTPQV